MENTLVHIGAQKDAVIEARKTITMILETRDDQETKRKALETLTALCQANNNSFMNCNFIGDPAPKKKKK